MKQLPIPGNFAVFQQDVQSLLDIYRYDDAVLTPYKMCIDIEIAGATPETHQSFVNVATECWGESNVKATWHLDGGLYLEIDQPTHPEE
jgi:hypothetical protein